eukprot:TRINITY_DN16357_c0_g6_i1.p1 TRINITY_DN16357_c0_g6~~TRINITY_DN16357_c0_g6_i1.p1  ORF type:complete len:175 (+),score=13.92 TRINITY_DN16357_c0_g6_i1:384-908(+)
MARVPIDEELVDTASGKAKFVNGVQEDEDPQREQDETRGDQITSHSMRVHPGLQREVEAGRSIKEKGLDDALANPQRHSHDRELQNGARCDRVRPTDGDEWEQRQESLRNVQEHYHHRNKCQRRPAATASASVVFGLLVVALGDHCAILSGLVRDWRLILQVELQLSEIGRAHV